MSTSDTALTTSPLAALAAAKQGRVQLATTQTDLCIDPPGASAALCKRFRQWCTAVNLRVARAFWDGPVCVLCGRTCPPPGFRLQVLYRDHGAAGLGALLEQDPRDDALEVWFAICRDCPLPQTAAGREFLAEQVYALVAAAAADA